MSLDAIRINTDTNENDPYAKYLENRFKDIYRSFIEDEAERSKVGQVSAAPELQSLALVVAHILHRASLREFFDDDVTLEEREGSKIDPSIFSDARKLIRMIVTLAYPSNSVFGPDVESKLLLELDKQLNTDADGNVFSPQEGEKFDTSDYVNALVEIYNRNLPDERKERDYVLTGKSSISLEVKGAENTRTIGRPWLRRS